MYMINLSNFICNSHKMEMIKMSFNIQMVKGTIIYPYHRRLFSNKKKQTIDAHNLDESGRHCAE